MRRQGKTPTRLEKRAVSAANIQLYFAYEIYFPPTNFFRVRFHEFRVLRCLFWQFQQSTSIWEIA